MLGLEGGCSFVTAVPSITIMFINTNFAVSTDLPVLPFTLQVSNYDLLFDCIEPSPVFESKSCEESARAPHRHPCRGSVSAAAAVAAIVAGGTRQDSAAVVAVDAETAFEVVLPTRVLAEVLGQCGQCFGYTADGKRCTHRRQPTGDKRTTPVWCHHHATQERVFRGFRVDGQRPPQCEWWGQ